MDTFSLGFFVSFISVALSIKDGSQIDPCTYPGLSVVLSPQDTVICNAVFVSDTQFIVPELCGSAMNGFLTKNDLKISYSHGVETIPITSTGELGDGIYSFTLSNPISNNCSAPATMYDSSTTTIDSSTCQVVGYGADTLSSKTYDGIANAISVTKSTSSPCCHVIMDSLSDAEKGEILTKTASFNCLTSPGATCGTGDIGAPVYCQIADGSRVLTGLTSSSPCISGGTFLVHDVTVHQTDFKFGF